MSYPMAYKIFSLLMLVGRLLLLWPLHAASRRLRAEIKELEAQAERNDACDPDL